MTQDSRWQTCRPGTIQAVASAQQESEQRGRRSRRSWLAGIAAAVGGCGILLLSLPAGDRKLTCAEVLDRSEQYVRGKLPTDEVRLVDAHRADCNHCDQMLTSLETRQSA